MKDETIKADFVVLEDLGAVNFLECPRCGMEFEINAHSGLNLTWDREFHGLVAICPLCGTQQE